MDARDSGLGISAVQLNHKVNQPLCLQAEQAQERQLLLSQDVSESHSERAEGGAVAVARRVDRSETWEGIKCLMFALKE